MQIDILYRDAMMLVIDKPAGIPVHKGRGGGENLEQSFDALRFGLPRVPSLAHRLDRDTSGCLVLGRHRQALHQLGKLFAAGKVGKTYWAVVQGAPPEERGTLALPLGKQVDSPLLWHMKVDHEKGQEAVTDYVLRGQGGGMSWLELHPRTGRTHQLRVHCQALGCPIAGDRIYGGGTQTPLQLHARAIEIPLYPKKPPIHAQAPVPGHMRALLEGCGFSGE